MLAFLSKQLILFLPKTKCEIHIVCCNLIANVKLRFILFVPTVNNSLTKFAFVFILILVVCKVIENRYFDEQVTIFFQPTVHQNFSAG